MTDMTYRVGLTGPSEALLSRWWRTIDKLSLSAAILLFVVGLMLAFAASPPLAQRIGQEPFHFVWRQAQFGSLALGLMFFLSVLRPATIRRLAVMGFLVTFAAVLLLPWFGSDFGKGATRWYSFGFGSVQPSEFLKPVFVVSMAWLMAAGLDRKGPPGLAMSFVITAGIATLLAFQPDFGQAALITMVWGVMFFASGGSMYLITLLGALVVAAAHFAYANSEHFARRVDGFFDTTIDPTTQIGHAASAIQEGGFFGVGVGEGVIKRTLPDAYTDFIIAVAAEEFGVILCFVIIGLFGLIVLRALIRLMRERDPFARLAGTGLAVMFGAQALINLGVAVRLLPAKGMTLPLVSYGGSSLIASGITLGMLLALTRVRPQDELEDVFGTPR